MAIGKTENRHKVYGYRRLVILVLMLIPFVMIAAAIMKESSMIITEKDKTKPVHK